MFVDAVDESQNRENLLKVLTELATDFRFDNLRLLATSREYIDIEEALLNVSTPISMRNDLLDQDISFYVRLQLSNHRKLKRWPQQIQEDVFAALSKKANGM